MTDFNAALCLALPSLRSRAARLTRNRADADDLMQATALQALLSQHRYDEIGSMGGWLATVMFSTHMNRIRHIRARPTEYMDGDLPDYPVEPVAELAVAVAQVGAALAKLTQEHRSIIIRDAEGYSYSEMAGEFGIPDGTVKSRLNRARLALSRHGEFV